MIVVGDIHGQVKTYLKLLDHYRGEPSIQVGDFGFGFPKYKELGPSDVGLKTPEELQWLEDNMPDNAGFIRGNHDEPALARKSKHYLGDYGIKVIDGHKVFFVSGAYSVDRRDRIEGVDWWPGEELSSEELEDALLLYKKDKPDIVISHDGPDQAIERLMIKSLGLHKGRYFSRTGQILSAMYYAHQPAKWIFGHWHTKYREIVGRTDFICLPIDGWCQIHGDFAKNKSDAG